jgi:hypothetical protein
VLQSHFFVHSFNFLGRSKASVPLLAVLRIRIRDPVPFWPRDPGWVKNQDLDPGSRSGMNNTDHISESLDTFFWVKILKFFDADPGCNKFRSGIRDKHPGSATLPIGLYYIRSDKAYLLYLVSLPVLHVSLTNYSSFLNKFVSSTGTLFSIIVLCFLFFLLLFTKGKVSDLPAFQVLLAC